jgi:hypothetical protein
MLHKKIILSLLITTGICAVASAQCPVKGTVYDALLLESLPGIEVRVKEMPDLRVVTDREGSFFIDAPCMTTITLFFEGIGYFTKTLLAVHKQESIEVFMDENIFEWTDRMIPIASIKSASFK